MPSTHLSIHLHLIFSTKNREPFIVEDWSHRLHAFLGGAVRTAQCVPEAIGGMEDHVHLLIGIRSTLRLSDIMRDIKQASSRWVHETVYLRSFAWQDGYAAFSVSTSQLSAVKAYLRNQAAHHRKRTFQEEYLDLLKQHRVNYDEKYLW
jgi:putative transposase